MVDNILKPIKIFAKKFAKESGNKALKSGISYASKNTGKKKSEKSGNLIMEKLRNMRIGNTRQKALAPPTQQQEESTDMIIDRLISGSGLKRRR